MRHAFVDNYAHLNTPIHRLAPKIKIIFLIFFLFLIVATPLKYKLLFSLYLITILILVFLSQIPLRFIFSRIVQVLPFVTVVALSALFKKEEGTLFLSCLIKAVLALLLVLVATASTSFSQLTQSLKELKVPAVFILLLSFMYRYTFLLEDQLLRAKRAFLSRSIKQRRFFSLKVLSNIIGVLFIRTYERAERVYLAMCARGYGYGKNH